MRNIFESYAKSREISLENLELIIFESWTRLAFNLGKADRILS